MVEGLKRDLNGARASAREGTTAAETARAKLSASEASWKQQRESLDREIALLNSRYALIYSL